MVCVNGIYDDQNAGEILCTPAPIPVLTSPHLERMAAYPGATEVWSPSICAMKLGMGAPRWGGAPHKELHLWLTA